VERTRWQPEFSHLAHMYLALFYEARGVFERYGNNLVAAFKQFQDAGRLRSSPAGHPRLFPAHGRGEGVGARAGEVAVAHYERHFGRPPRGIWLPECGFNPGDDVIMKEAGLSFSSATRTASCTARRAPSTGCLPRCTVNPGWRVSAATSSRRNRCGPPSKATRAISNTGSFYRDIGFDLDYDYIRPYIHPDGIRINTGIKYYAISGSDDKRVYNRLSPAQRRPSMPGISCSTAKGRLSTCMISWKKADHLSPYDAELFGHWWYEGRCGWSS